MAILNSKKLRVAAQIQAENDLYLFECFHDDGMIEKLVDNRFELIAGRKGTGKTAISRYLQKFHKDYGIDYATRLTLTDLQTTAGTESIDGERLLRFLAITTAQHLLKKKLMTKDGTEYWNDYLKTHGLQDVSSYTDFALKAKKVFERKEAGIGIPKLASASLNHDDTLEYEKQAISDSSSSLLNRLGESLDDDKKVIIIIDDITDQFDNPGLSSVKESMKQIKHILHQLNNHNTHYNDEGVDLTFVCTIRDDLWDYILGSNENKLIHNCLWIEWNEKNFCEMLIKRLPHFANNLTKSLEDPYESIRSVFPDAVIEEVLAIKGVKQEEIKQYRTKFYAYMQLISFNRPRDFLRLCHAMKTRLSEVKPVEVKHIKASELEYSDYFYKELRDELNIFSILMDGDAKDTLDLMSELSKKSRLSYQEFKMILSHRIKASHTNTQWFIRSLWDYSLIGVMATTNKDQMHFKHNVGRNNGYELPGENELKAYYFLLHRGLYWKYTMNRLD